MHQYGTPTCPARSIFVELSPEYQKELDKTYLFNGYAGHTTRVGNVQRGLHYRGAVLITGFDINYNWESREANQYTTTFISNWCEEGAELTVVEVAAMPAFCGEQYLAFVA